VVLAGRDASKFVHHMHVTALHVRHLPVPVKRFRQSRTNQVFTGHGHAKARTLLNAPTATTIMKINVDIQVQALWRAVIEP
jgi:hypothetical protein